MKYIQHDGRAVPFFVPTTSTDLCPAPITFDIPGAPQTYAGEWDTLKMTSISKDQTAVYWNIYSCFSVESRKSPAILMLYPFLATPSS